MSYGLRYHSCGDGMCGCYDCERCYPGVTEELAAEEREELEREDVVEEVPAGEGKKWFNVWAFPSMRHICAVTAKCAEEVSDPRIGGDGNIIVQEA